MSAKVIKKPDTMDDISGNDLIQLSRNLLGSIVDSTDMMNLEKMTPNKMKEAKVVLGFLNAADRTMKTKMQYFRMAGIKDKVNAVKQKAKSF